MDVKFSETPHRRLNRLTGEWIQLSPHRNKRPWQGKQEEQPSDQKPGYDANCYLCPGNKRTGGAQNPDYTSTFVFDNDFSALLPNTEEEVFSKNDLLTAKTEKGIC